MQACCCFQMHQFVDACEAELQSCCVSRSRHLIFSLIMWCWLFLRHSVSLHQSISLVGFGYFLLFSSSVVLPRSLCKFLTSRAHLLRSLAMLIQVLLVWLLLSIGFSVSSNSCLRNSLMSSSHLFLRSSNRSVGLVNWAQFWVPFTSLFQPSFTRWCCDSQCQFPFHFLWVLFQHRIFALSIFSMASSVLLFMYSIQSSSSINVVSISSSASSSNETSLSTSLWVVVLWPSPLSSSVLHISLMSISSISSLVPISCFSIFLYFLFVWMMSRSILRCVDWIILSCSLLGAHVPAA